MHTVRCECAVYRPGNCRETPKNLIFQEREKELREEHRRHRRFRDRDDDELRTEDKTMCFATKKALRSWEVKKLQSEYPEFLDLRSWVTRVTNWTKTDLAGLAGLTGRTRGIDLCPAGFPTRVIHWRIQTSFFHFFHFFIELKIMVSIFWKTEFQSFFGVDLCLSFLDWNLETLKPWRSTRQVRWDAFAVSNIKQMKTVYKPWNLFSL